MEIMGRSYNSITTQDSDTGSDFLNHLDCDTCLKIFLCLDDHADLVRASCVSRSWRRFAIENGLCKRLCWKLFPSSARIDRVVEEIPSTRSTSEVGCSSSLEFDNFDKEHRAYAFLARGCVSFPQSGLIADAISASSTDNYPDESVRNTLELRERVARRASYWSSKGQSDPSSPEVLVYKLVSKICVISEINIQPFQAYFQWGSPIYSAKAVRFRMGHLKNHVVDFHSEPCDNLADDNFVWTYTSPIFPMAQENTLQSFKLPEPVLCLGGHMQIELIGRVQRQEMDSLFYICICYVEAMGRSLSPAFDIDVEEKTGKLVLKALSYDQPTAPEIKPPPQSTGGPFPGNERHLELIVNMLRGGVDLEGFVWMNGEDDLNEEFLD